MNLDNKFLNSVVIAKRGRQIKDHEEESAVDHHLTNPILTAIDELKSGKIKVEIHDEVKLGRNHDDDDLDLLYSNLKVKEEVDNTRVEVETEFDFEDEPSEDDLASIEEEEIDGPKKSKKKETAIEDDIEENVDEMLLEDEEDPAVE